jgi:hypothetical protein
MKILNEDRTSAVAGGTALSGFPASNVENDRPRKPWISTTTTSETFTISLNASVGYPVQAMFLHGLLCDSATWVLKNQSGATVDSGTLDCAFPAESDLSGNPNNMNVYFVNQAHLMRSFFVVFDTTVTDNGSVVLTMTTSQNMGSANIEGNSVASWVRDGTDAGRLLDSSGDAINIQNHGRIFVGSHIVALATANPVTTDTTISTNTLATSPFQINASNTVTINGGVTVTVTDDPTSAQITSITGDGTASSGIGLSSDLATIGIAQVYNPIRIGIARAGKTIDLPTPAPNMSFHYKDYSVRRRQPTGGYSYQQRPIAREVQGTSVLTTAQAQSLQNFYRGYRSKPVPVLFVEGMPTVFEEEEKGNLFGYFQQPPQFSFINRDYQNVSFSLCEVI